MLCWITYKFWVYPTSDPLTQVTRLVVIKYQHMTAQQAMWKYQSWSANGFKRDFGTPRNRKPNFAQSNSSAGTPPALYWESLKFRISQFINGADEPPGEIWRPDWSATGKFLQSKKISDILSDTRAYQHVQTLTRSLKIWNYLANKTLLHLKSIYIISRE